MKFVINILIFTVVHSTNGLSVGDPLVTTKIGVIKGVQATDGDYNMFVGIPYGKVNASNPFSTSTPYPPFEDVYEANDDSVMCPQIDIITKEIVGIIDCLRLNVYIPRIASTTNPLPVMVWIHGGAFWLGSGARSHYGPKFLVRHNIILVTINYRVGPYGFMCTDLPEVPGNQGLKDQRLALRWVKDNIEQFGGDVNKITIAGQSAGAKSVDFHVHLSKDNVFRSAIIQSGTVLLPHLETESDSKLPITLANAMGSNATELSQALSFLATAEPGYVIAATATANLVFSFVPCYEKTFEGVDNFLTDYSVNLIPTNVKGMDVLIGFTDDEWLWTHHTKTEEDYRKWNGFNHELKKYFTFQEDLLKEMEESVRHFYIGNKSIGEEVKSDLRNFDADFLFIHPAKRTVDKFIEYGARNIYFYEFSYKGARNWARVSMNIMDGGATHGDDNGYLFDIAFLKGTPTEADQIVIDRMTMMWANFVKYGDPTPSTSDLLPTKWIPITGQESKLYYLDIDSNLTLEEQPFSERMSFWDQFYKRNAKFQKGYANKNI